MRKLSRKELKRSHIELTENDHLIITGDFGFPFTPDDIKEYDNGEKTEYTEWIRWFKERPYKVLFVDGNHDNHDWWREQPVTEMFGGRVQVHPHAENVIHLMRGEVYEIEGKTFFTFGGAASTDKKWRKEGYSWWSGEEASYAETEHALDKIKLYRGHLRSKDSMILLVFFGKLDSLKSVLRIVGVCRYRRLLSGLNKFVSF